MSHHVTIKFSDTPAKLDTKDLACTTPFKSCQIA